jgi:hypothetical protein
MESEKKMLKKVTASYTLILVWFTNLALGQYPGVEDPLPEFLSRLSASTQSVVAIKFSSSGGPVLEYEKFYRSKGKHGVIGPEGGGGIRAIWNPKYHATIENIDQDKWMLQYARPHNDKDGYKTQSVMGLFIGPLIQRFDFLELVGVTNETNGLLYEYRYTSDYSGFSSDPVLNSFFIKFSEDSGEKRLKEIRHWDGGSDMKISSSFVFEYPEGSFFPLKRIGKAVVMSGEMKNTKFEMEDRVEVDSDAKFVLSECYLSHYGLPEPSFSTDFVWFNRRITWWFVGLVSLSCCILLVSKYLRVRRLKN